MALDVLVSASRKEKYRYKKLGGCLLNEDDINWLQRKNRSSDLNESEFRWAIVTFRI